MKIGIFTTISDPIKWQYAFDEAMDCYSDIADEVVVVDGSLEEKINYRKWPKARVIKMSWPYEWSYSELPLHIQRGFDVTSTDCDVAIKMDIDYLFHEQDKEVIRERLEEFMNSDAPIASFEKFSVINANYGFIKSDVAIAINMNFRSNIAFGRNLDKPTDWCFPVLKYKKDKEGVWVGKEITRLYKTNILVYNYDYFFRTIPVAQEAFARFARAYKRTTGNADWGADDEQAFRIMFQRFTGRAGRATTSIPSHPRYIEKKVHNLNEEQLGYDNWFKYR